MVPLGVLADALPGNEDPAADTAGAEARARIWSALDRLTPEQKEALVLKHVEGPGGRYGGVVGPRVGTAANVVVVVAVREISQHE